MEFVLEEIGKSLAHEVHLYPLTLKLGSGLHVLLGPTLAGKTSLMRIMAGLDKPSSGRITLDAKDLSKVRVQDRKVAFVYQQFINYPSLNVFENIASPLRVEGRLKARELREKVEAAAEMMQIQHLLKRMPAELSGGQQQRTAIARALVKDADLLLLDEPLVNLDYKLREELRSDMRDIFSHREAIVVYATTEPQEALMLGGTTTILDKGRLLQHGPTLEVYHQPSYQRVGEVFSDPPMNMLAAELKGGRFHLASGHDFMPSRTMTQLAEGDYTLGLRAHHVSLKPITGGVKLRARLELAEISGSQTFLHLHLDPNISLVAQLDGVHSYDFGQDLDIYLNPDKLFAFDQTSDQTSDQNSKLVASPAYRTHGLKEA
ncbi:MAG: ABC transporter ATP-binding protein [Deinococcales bacterium]